MASSWSEVRQDHLRIRYKVATANGRQIVTHLCVETHPDAGEPQSITASDLQRIKPRDLARGYAERLASWTATDEHGNPAFRSQPVEPYSDEHLAHVAQLMRYMHGGLPGLPVATVLQQSYGVSPATAHRWIARAREMYPDLPQRRRGPKPKGGTSHG